MKIKERSWLTAELTGEKNTYAHWWIYTQTTAIWGFMYVSHNLRALINPLPTSTGRELSGSQTIPENAGMVPFTERTDFRKEPSRKKANVLPN